MHMLRRSRNSRIRDLQNRLAESESRFRGIIERNADGVIVLDREGIIRFVNPAAERLMGRDRRDLVGFPFGFPVAGKDAVELDLVMAGGGTAVAEMRVVETEWEELPAFLVSMRDVTERKETEERLKGSLAEVERRRLETEALLECAHAILRHRDFEGAAREVFDAAKRVIGAESGYVALLNEEGAENEVLFLDSGGRPCHVDPALPMPVRGLRAEAYRSGKAVFENRFDESEWTGLLPDGHVRLENVLFGPLMLEGRAVGLIGLANKAGGFTSRDAELAEAFGEYAAIALLNSRNLDRINRSERRYRSLFETSREGIAFLSLEGRIQEANRACQEMLGYSLEELRGMHYLELTAEPWREMERTRVEGKVLQEGYSGEFEEEALRRDGTPFPVAVRRWLVQDDKGRPVRMMALLQDISERKRMESRIQQAHKMEAIGTLAGGIAHDFNNILGIIVGNAELALTDPVLQESTEKSLDEIRTASIRARDVVRQILTFTRYSDPILEPVRMDVLVEEGMRLIRSTLPTHVEIEVSLPDEPSTVAADSAKVHQILINLCTNAFHAMRRDGGRLSVRLENVRIDTPGTHEDPALKPGPYVRLEVRDTGHGIPPEIQDRIFDPYFTTKDVNEGSGMGLSVVQGIVKSHGGGISVRSRPGSGAVFTVHLPRLSDEERKAEEEDARPGPGEGERILLVDDEASLADVGRSMLERLGYRVSALTDSVKALRAFEGNPDGFDLVITDQSMPGMTGADLAREILRRRPGKPVVLCTGYSDLVDPERARQLGVRSFLLKPFSYDQLADVVREALAESGSA
jgi:PAS domain S-box-containing protein